MPFLKILEYSYACMHLNKRVSQITFEDNQNTPNIHYSQVYCK